MSGVCTRAVWLRGRERTGWAKTCADADTRRDEIAKEIEGIERDPKSRNPNGALYARIMELKAERDRLPRLYDIDPRFTLAPASGMINVDDVVKARGSKARLDLQEVRDSNWHTHALLRGIGVHHVQIKGQYRLSVEFLFRKKQLSVVFATSTLAQVCAMSALTSVPTCRRCV